MCSLITTTNRNHVLLPPLGLLIFYFSCLVLGGDKLLRFLRRQGSSRQIKQTPIVEIYIYFFLLFWLCLIDVFMAQESSNLLCKFSYLNHLTGSNEREAESDIKSLQDQRHKHLKEVDFQRMLQYFPILFTCKAFFI